MNFIRLSKLVLARSFSGKLAPRLLAATTSMVCFIPAAVSARDEITGLNVFGDSLMDAGNLFNLTGLPPSPPYDQKFSNGPIWVEQLADELNLAPALPLRCYPACLMGR